MLNAFVLTYEIHFLYFLNLTSGFHMSRQMHLALQLQTQVQIKKTAKVGKTNCCSLWNQQKFKIICLKKPIPYGKQIVFLCGINKSSK